MSRQDEGTVDIICPSGMGLKKAIAHVNKELCVHAARVMASLPPAMRRERDVKHNLVQRKVVMGAAAYRYRWQCVNIYASKEKRHVG